MESEDGDGVVSSSPRGHCLVWPCVVSANEALRKQGMARQTVQGYGRRKGPGDMFPCLLFGLTLRFYP